MPQSARDYHRVDMSAVSPVGFGPSSSSSSAAPLISPRPSPARSQRSAPSSAASSSARRYAPGGFTNSGGTSASALVGAAAALRSTSASVSSHTNSGRSSGSGEKYGVDGDPAMLWHGRPGEPEPDDWLHNIDPVKDRYSGGRGFKDTTGTIFTLRGLMNIGSLVLLAAALLMLFAGYPILTYFFKEAESKKGGFNLGGTNGTGQLFTGVRGLVDPDTPAEARSRMSLDGRRRMQLVFSDEFEEDGRSFYPGDDPFWTAVDLHYWGTGDYEWYEPAGVTTANGRLVFTLIEQPTHNLNFRSGMLQSWNQFCFTGGFIEVSLRLPGSHDIAGLWPAAWTMGNLGRAGHGATTDGLWPYTYDACDVGTLPNQTYPASQGGGPIAAETTGAYPDQYGPSLSYLPGQRLSRCTCPGSDHPGPYHSDGSYVGRAAPEIDIIEASAGVRPGSAGHVSMSCQLAPFNNGLNLTTGPGAVDFFGSNRTENELNAYQGAVYQQTASVLVTTDNDVYEDTGGRFERYGFEYKPGYDADSHVTWTVGDDMQWRLGAQALAADPATEISARPIPMEPMYIIMNLGLSSAFSYVDFDRLAFPAKMEVDWVRVYQDEDKINVGCDPPDFPTKDYIERHYEAYTNPNLTTWTEPRSRGGMNMRFPGNRLAGDC